MFEAVGDIYRLLSILHIPLKIEMLTIGAKRLLSMKLFAMTS